MRGEGQHLQPHGGAGGSGELRGGGGGGAEEGDYTFRHLLTPRHRADGVRKRTSRCVSWCRHTAFTRFTPLLTLPHTLHTGPLEQGGAQALACSSWCRRMTSTCPTPPNTSSHPDTGPMESGGGQAAARACCRHTHCTLSTHFHTFLHPTQGRWSEEEDKLLRELVQAHGHSWERIGVELGRMGQACQDRWKIIKIKNRVMGRCGRCGGKRGKAWPHEAGQQHMHLPTMCFGMQSMPLP